MSRQLAFYSEDEILTDLYTSGKEWQLRETSTEYVGLYHRYKLTGEVYTLAEWNEDKSKQLEPYEDLPLMNKRYKKLKEDMSVKYQTVTPLHSRIPTADEYAAGTMERYFIKKVNEDIVHEIDEDQFFDWINRDIDPYLYQSTTLVWNISGTINDERRGSSIIPGVRTKNKRALQEAETDIPGISKLLTNLLEYYEDTEYSVPADINIK